MSQWQSQEVQSVSDSSQNNKSLQSFLSYLKPFPIVTTLIQSFLYFILNHLLILHLLMFFSFYQFDNFNRETGSFFRILLQLTSPLPLLISMIVLFLTLIFTLVIYFNEQQQSGIKYFIQKLTTKLFPYSRIFIQFCFSISSFLLYTNDSTAIILFSIIVLLRYSTTILNTNFLLRKDYLCCHSLFYLLLMRTTQILSIVINVLSLKYNFPALILHLLLSLTLYLSYFKVGYQTYHHFASRMALVCYISAYFGFSLTACVDIVRPSSLTAFYSTLGLTTIGLIILTRTTIQTMRINMGSLSREMDYVAELVQVMEEDVEDDCIIRGILKAHIIVGCTNVLCFSKSKELHDGKKKKDVSCNNIKRDKLSLAKYYVKCILEREEQSKQNTIRYIEHCFNKLRSALYVFDTVQMLEKGNLTPLHKLHLIRLKQAMKVESEVMRKELPNQIDFERVLHLEDQYTVIEQTIYKYLQKAGQFWIYVMNNKVDISVLRVIADQLFALRQDLCQQWKDISKYLQHNVRWKFYFLCYSLYIKNEKVKYQLMEQFGSSVRYQGLFKTQQFQSRKNETQFSSKMIFEHNSCLMQARWQQNDLVVKKASMFCESVLGYQCEQLKQCSIRALMPYSISAIHNKIFLDWAYHRVNTPAHYTVRRIYPIHKQGHIAICNVQVKQFVQKGQLLYVGVLKSVPTLQMSMLLNIHYEVEAMTFQLIKVFRLQQMKEKLAQYRVEHNTIQINMLSIVPELVGKKVMQKIAEAVRVKKSQSIKAKIGNKKNMYEVQGKMRLPKDWATVLQIYTKSKGEGVINGINQVRKYIKTLQKDQYLQFQYSANMTKITLFNEQFYQLLFKRCKLLNQEIQKEIIQQQQQINQMEVIQRSNFNSFFQRNKSINNQISILSSNNIFLKDESNQANDSFFPITFIILVIRIFFIILIIIALFQFFFQENFFTKISTIGRQYKTINEINKDMYQLSLYYSQFKYSDDIINIDSNNISQRIITAIKSKEFKMLLFSAVGVNQNITIIIPNSTIKLQSMVDILFSIQGIIISLSTQTLTKINKTTDFQVFKQLLLPTFNNFIQTQLSNLQNEFYLNIQSIKMYIIIALTIYGVLALINLLAFIISINTVMNSFHILIELYVQLDQFIIKKITDYLIDVRNVFEQIDNKNNQYRRGISSQNQQNRPKEQQFKNSLTLQQQKQQRNNANLNKKAKQIQSGKLMRAKKLQPILIFTTIIIVYISLMLGYNLIKYQAMSQFQTYFHNSKRLQSFALPYILSQSCYNPQNKPLIYSPFINSLQSIVANDTVFPDFSNNFSSSEYTILMGRLCDAYPELLPKDVSQTKCNEVSAQQLQAGVYGLLKHILPDLTSCSNREQTAYSLRIIGNYLLYLINVWQQVFAKNVQRSIGWIIALVGLQVLIHVILVQHILVQRLEKEYVFYKDLYSNMMPESVVFAEKTIKARLQVEGFLKK